MKHLLTLALFVVIITTSNATVRIITCQNVPSHFLPATANAVCGDTIRWTWVEGGHIVGPINSSDIPAGALMWNGPIDALAAHHVYEYVVTVPGNYHYVCHPANPHGEDAYIVVTCANGVQNYTTNPNLFSVYPNPSTGKFTLSTELTKGKVSVYNLLGRKIFEATIVSPDFTIDLSKEAAGIYLIQLYSDQAILTKKMVIQ